jgi:arginase
MQKELVFLINTSEITAGTRGASLGPGAIMTAVRKQENTLFGENQVKVLKEQNHLLDLPTKYKFAKRIDGLVEVYKELNIEVSSVLKEGKFPFVLAGDHGSAGGTIAAIKSTFPLKRLGVVWIDAHADMHTPYTTPSGNIHGMPLATALNEDNLPCKKNDILGETGELWQELKTIGGIAPKISPSDLVFIAVRDTEEQEDAMMNRLNIKNYKVEEVNQKGEETVLNEIFEKLNDCDLIYVSFDVDSMDPDVTSYGTGTPVKNGLSIEQASKLLKGLTSNEKTCCVEFVEVNPCLDEKRNKMGEVAADLVLELVEIIKK